jgi:hypothetical protein
VTHNLLSSDQEILFYSHVDFNYLPSTVFVFSYQNRRRIASKLNGSDGKMENSEKKKETSSFDENELEEQIVIPLKQMIQDDDDDDDDEGNWMGETVTHLTGKVCSILQVV